MSDVVVTDVTAAERYEASIGEEFAGFLEYRRAGKTVIVFAHTEVEPAFEGRGVGGSLVRAPLDDIRAQGDVEVVPTCPFVSSWIAAASGVRRRRDPGAPSASSCDPAPPPCFANSRTLL